MSTVHFGGQAKWSSDVTRSAEENLTDSAGIRQIRSMSKDGSSKIHLEFLAGTDIEGDWIRLGNVAEIEIGVEGPDTGFRFDGEDAISVGVIRQSTPTRWRSPIEIAARVGSASIPNPRAIQETSYVRGEDAILTWGWLTRFRSRWAAQLRCSGNAA